ncbi:helix-turn-helix domain-containing protein [Streptomyces flavidovirens]|uniref:Helix-turn-helix domain-containing protein n=1 Tax=Streptomyces flavidovirens TaxID=67298 RepID=A0ABW6RPU0_9ACTN
MTRDYRCLNAGCQKKLDQSAAGRRRLYCSDKCGRAYRKARSAQRTPETRAHDAYAVQVAADLVRQTGMLRELVGLGEPVQALALLGKAVKDVDDLRDALVQQARDRGIKPSALAAALHISVDKLGRDHSADRVERRMRGRMERTGRTPPPTSRSTVSPPLLSTGSIPAGDRLLPSRRPANPEGGAEGPSDNDPAATLALAFSHLQRSSHKSIRALSDEVGVSPSYISRILTGDRCPSWRIAHRLTQSCGGDPADIRPLWDTTRGHRVPEPDQLTAALRGLYLSAARPPLARVRSQSGNRLSVEHIHAVLNGSEIPPWETVDQLVGALHGQPQVFRPLWDAARNAQPTEPSHPAAGEQRGPLAESF